MIGKLHQEPAPLSAVVLVSGGGTNLQALIDATAAGELPLDVKAVISNRPDAYGLVRATKAGIPGHSLDHTRFSARSEFDAALANLIAESDPDLIILAGFMRILSAAFVERYEGRILNIHPSLLPKYPGLNTHQRALDAGDDEHGVTVHFVTAELDGGPPVLQGRIPVMEGDDADSLAARVLFVEHKIYAQTVRLIAEGRLEWRDHRVWFDGTPLLKPLSFKDSGPVAKEI